MEEKKIKKIFPSEKWGKWDQELILRKDLQNKYLQNAYSWLSENSVNNSFRFIVILDGKILIEWYKGFSHSKPLPIWSAAKSVYSNILGIALKEKKINSIDEKIINYYPEFLNVKEKEGPKENRHAFKKDKEISFNHLITNTSGYMKPGEIPGRVFHYQTYGMNILIHSLAKIYGYKEYSKNFYRLIKNKLAAYIGVKWSYDIANFDLHKDAKTNIFGNYCQIKSNALDMARLGWLWCNYGKWKDIQVIPEEWVRISTKTSNLIVENCPRENWKYGMGFWTNDYGLLWPELPRNSYTASGAGGHYISVFPDFDLVIIQSPGPYFKGERGNQSLLKIILNLAKEFKNVRGK
jgi:CubicO group peptidase (beta-lactamase class C family)